MYRTKIVIITSAIGFSSVLGALWAVGEEAKEWKRCTPVEVLRPVSHSGPGLVIDKRGRVSQAVFIVTRDEKRPYLCSGTVVYWR